MNQAPGPKRATQAQAQGRAQAQTQAQQLPVEDAQQWTNRRASAQATRAANARQASGRRRFVDPTTCERDYSSCELEFMQAMQDYKKQSGRMFPTWSEVLEVLRSLGYEKPGRTPVPAGKTPVVKAATAKSKTAKLASARVP
jgi:hypothetical protein